MKAGKTVFLGVTQIEVSEQFPTPQRKVANERVLNFAEPSHNDGHEQTRNTVGKEEIEGLLLENTISERGDVHGCGQGLFVSGEKTNIIDSE